MKYSRQREIIYQSLASRYDHPTAEILYQDIKKEYSTISLGTVYRNLSLLTEVGQIQKISTGFGPDRFDGNPVPHMHFLCRKCTRVIDVESQSDSDYQSITLKDFDGTIDCVHVELIGLCPECNKATMNN